MTRDLQRQKADTSIYQLNLRQTEMVEIEKVQLQEAEERIINKNRFKRYKKSIQKRARNIL